MEDNAEDNMERTGDYNDRRIEVFEVLELVGLGVEDAVCVCMCVCASTCVSIH